ncbi:MAG: branched-chain amino acid ABC transporter permease [Thaumarchaeota archaeon]|nr:branched-chain amino acid ABC transporter permease [Nitrososphaerota archaeon]
MLGWLIPSLILSLLVGSIYVLASLGMTLSLAVLKLPNFAHAELLTVGAYATVIVALKYPGNIILAGLAAFAVCALLALAVHYLVYRPLINKRVSVYILLLSSFAVALFLRYSIYSWASVANLLFAQPKIPVYVVGYFYNASITNIELITIPLALIVSLALGGFLTFTRIGTSMRAVAINFDLARISGIRISRVVALMWIIGGGLAGIGGAVFGIYTVATPDMGYTVLLEIFTVVIIAGLTSMSGTIIGGYLVGFAENTVAQALYIYFGVPLTYEPLLPFGIMILVLLVRPSGISPNFQKMIDYFRKSTITNQVSKI